MSTIVERAAGRDRLALAAIFLVPLIWGAGFPLTHNAVARVDPGLYAFARSLVATFALLPFVLHRRRRGGRTHEGGEVRATAAKGFVLAVFGTLNIAAQSYALTRLSSATMAFWVAVSIVFVPFIMPLLRLGYPSALDLASVAVGLAGVFVMLGRGVGGTPLAGLLGGVAAFSIAMNICLVQRFTGPGSRADRLMLAFCQMGFGTLLLAGFPLAGGLHALAEPRVALAVGFMGVLATALALMIQLSCQPRVGGARTAVIFNLDLPFAYLFGALNGEPLAPAQLAGGAVMVLASMLGSLHGLWRRLDWRGGRVR